MSQPLPSLLRLLALLLMLALGLASPAFAASAAPSTAPPAAEEEEAHTPAPSAASPPTYETGVVREVKVLPGPEEGTKLLRAEVELSSGPNAGKMTPVEELADEEENNSPSLKAGDRILLAQEAAEDGVPTYRFVDYQRSGALLSLLALVLLLLLVVGGVRGFKTLFIAGGTLALLGLGFVPLALKGLPLLPLAVAFGLLVALLTLLLSAGPGVKTWSAAVGMLCSMAASAGVGTLFVGWARLSGTATAEAQVLKAALAPNLDFTGLVVAAMVIGALGIATDLALSISSSVEELRLDNPKLGTGALFLAGMQVGRDLLGTVVNTLLLAYLAGMLPLLLLLGGQGAAWRRAMNLELLAGDVAMLLVGLVGLICAIPFSSLAAAWMGKRKA